VTIATGYCTNVHAGADLPTTRANLERHTLEVKRLVSPDHPMGVGLWLCAEAARSLRQSGLDDFAAWLREVGLVPFTFNGFPYGDFHQPIVKHRVYEPTWADPKRLDYTLDLVAIQDALLPPGMEGSISTMPIAWGRQPPDALFQAAAANLRRLADALARLEAEQGRTIYVCLEPEPGCVLHRADDIVRFFDAHLGTDPAVRRHLRVCHDVCHSAVMFEPQEEALRTYAAAGVLIGKVQVSSAIQLDFKPLSPTQRVEAVQQFRAFAEDRYLHQTSVRAPGEASVLHEDLPRLLDAVADPAALESEWRTHFHMPIHQTRFGHLSSTQDDILALLTACRRHSDVRHFEVETYAWSVLPPALRPARLADGIADEMRWFDLVQRSMAL
jgi:sugar phosphate isomerase/epimerase